MRVLKPVLAVLFFMFMALLMPGNLRAEGDKALQKMHGPLLKSVDYPLRYKFFKDYGTKWGDSTYSQRQVFLNKWYEEQRQERLKRREELKAKNEQEKEERQAQVEAKKTALEKKKNRLRDQKEALRAEREKKKAFREAIKEQRQRLKDLRKLQKDSRRD